MKNSQKRPVREIMMSSPVTLKPDDHLQLASDLISLGRIRHIPIVDDGKLLGILSERDLIGSAAARILKLSGRRQAALLKTIPIREVMRRRVVSVEPETPITEAAELMAEKKISCLPVLSDGTLVGLITTNDILRYVQGLE